LTGYEAHRAVGLSSEGFEGTDISAVTIFDAVGKPGHWTLPYVGLR
jgi:hypothetical protein